MLCVITWIATGDCLHIWKSQCLFCLFFGSSWHGTKRGHGTKESWQLRHVRLEEEHLQQCRVPVLPGRCWRWQSHVVHWPGHFLRGMIWVWVKTCQDLWTYHMIKGITWNNHPKTSYLRDLGIFRVPRVPSRVPGFDPYGMNTEWCCSACSTALCFLKWLEVVTFRDDSMRKMTLVDYLSIPPPRTLQLKNLADVSHQFPPCPTSTNCPRLWNNMQWGQPYYHKYVLNIYIYIIIIYI